MIYSLTYNPTAEDHDTLTLKGDGAIDFEAASTILIKDNEASALVIKEGVNSYLTLKTTDSSEQVTIHKATRIAGDLKVEGGASGGVNSTSTPVIDLYQNDYPAGDDGDILGKVKFTAHNDNGLTPETIEYGSMYAEIIDETPGTEDGSLHFGVQTAGSLAATVLTLNGTVSTLNTPLVINSDYMELVSTQTSSQGEMPVLSLYRNNTTDISDSDDIGSIRFFATNEDNLKCFYAGIYADAIKQDDDGAHQGAIRFHLADGGGGATSFGTVTTSIAGDEDPIMSLFKYGLSMSPNNDFILGQNGVLTFEGATSNSNETHLFCVDPTNNDNTILLPDASGTVVLKDSTDTLTNKSIAATQLTGTIDNGRLPAAATNITSVGTLSGLTTGATTVNGALTVNNDYMELRGTNDGGDNTLPLLSIFRDVAVAGVGSDPLGGIVFSGRNEDDRKVSYASVYAVSSNQADDGEHEGGSIAFTVADGSGAVDPFDDFNNGEFDTGHSVVLNASSTRLQTSGYLESTEGRLLLGSKQNIHSSALQGDAGQSSYDLHMPESKRAKVMQIGGIGPFDAWITGNQSVAQMIQYRGQNMIIVSGGALEFELPACAASSDISTTTCNIGDIFQISNAAGGALTIDRDGSGTAQTIYHFPSLTLTPFTNNPTLAVGGTMMLQAVAANVWMIFNDSGLSDA